MRAWIFVVLVAAAAPHDRTFTVNRKEVTIPGAWVGCKEAADCAWVLAICDQPVTAVNAKFAKAARAKFDKACKGSDERMLRARTYDDPPPCDRNQCGELGPGLGPGGKVRPTAPRRPRCRCRWRCRARGRRCGRGRW